MTLVSSGSGGSNTMSNNHIYNVLNLSTGTISAIGAARDLDAGTYAMLFDDDSSTFLSYL